MLPPKYFDTIMAAYGRMTKTPKYRKYAGPCFTDMPPDDINVWALDRFMEWAKERGNTDGGNDNPMIDRAADAASVVNDGATANGIDERDAPSPPS